MVDVYLFLYCSRHSCVPILVLEYIELYIVESTAPFAVHS